VFGRSVVAGYMRRCLLHSNCSPESPAALPLLGLPSSHCSSLVSCRVFPLRYIYALVFSVAFLVSVEVVVCLFAPCIPLAL